jgi:hypothetical protein
VREARRRPIDVAHGPRRLRGSESLGAALIYGRIYEVALQRPAATAHPSGTVLYAVPAGAVHTTINGTTYFVSNGV